MKNYCCSDLHGMYDLYEQIDNFTQSDDKIYFLGDAADRGPQGWKLIKALANNPKWIWIQGNHDAMLAAAMREYASLDHIGPKCRLLFSNGGKSTFNDWVADGADLYWAYYLESLPKYRELYLDGKTICLSHAGFTPCCPGENFLPSDEELLWNRDHYYCSWWPTGYDNFYIIHGHTPIEYIPGGKEDMGIYKYHDHKIAIDNACWFYKSICLLDLVTFEPIRFTLS